MKLISKADLFFISTSYYESSMGTNHRGGPPGFVRVITNDDSSTSLVFPEYSGNRLYQSLGNLQTNPKAGLVFPDFDNQDVLFVTGTTEILIGEAAANLLPRSNLVVKLTLAAARFVQGALGFRGVPDEFSPYNPPVRFLPTENSALRTETVATETVFAQLIKKENITPSIIRVRFKISKPQAIGKWTPGQYVALSFEAELSAGYSHMRDSDPKSLNDDFIRTFTISSPPTDHNTDSPNLDSDAGANEFEITLRVVGVATRFLSRQHPRSGLSLPLKGFGGSFTIPSIPGTNIPFVAGGIGITPLLAYLPSLALAASISLRLFWMINIRDINLALDTFRRYPILVSTSAIVKIFLSGVVPETELPPTQATQLQALYTLLNISSTPGSEEGSRARAEVFQRRITATDIASEVDNNQAKTEEDELRHGNDKNPQADALATWYICAAPAARKEVLGWLAALGPEGRIKAVYEDFGY